MDDPKPLQRPFISITMGVALLVLIMGFAVYPLLGWGFLADSIFLPFHFRHQNLQWWVSFYADSGMGYIRTAFQLFCHAAPHVLGYHPIAWDLVAFFSHFLATISVWLLAAKLMNHRWWGCLAALIFGVHVAHWDVHFWPGAMNDSICVTGFCLAIYFYLQYRERLDNRYLVFCLVSTLYSCQGKEQAILIAPVLLLFEISTRLFRPKILNNLIQILKRWLSVAAICFFYLILFTYVQSKAANSFSATDRISYLSIDTFWRWIDYMQAQFWPFDRFVHFPSISNPASLNPRWWMDLTHPELPTGTGSNFQYYTMLTLFFIILVAAISRNSIMLALFIWWAGMSYIPATLNLPMYTRYTYSASPPAIILFILLTKKTYEMIKEWNGKLFAKLALKSALYFVLLSFIGINIFATWYSPSMITRRAEARLTMHLSSQLKEIAPTIKSTDFVIIGNHPFELISDNNWLYFNSVLTLAGATETPETVFLDFNDPLPPFPPGSIIIVFDFNTGMLNASKQPVIFEKISNGFINTN